MAAAELLDHEQLPSPSSPTSQPHIQHELRSRPPPRPPMNSPTGNLPPHLLSQPRLPIVAAMGDGRIIGVRSHPKPTKIDLLTALVCARRHVDFVLLENERADYNAVVELVVEVQGDTSNEIKLEEDEMQRDWQGKDSLRSSGVHFPGSARDARSGSRPSPSQPRSGGQTRSELMSRSGNHASPMPPGKDLSSSLQQTLHAEAKHNKVYSESESYPQQPRHHSHALPRKPNSPKKQSQR